MVNRDQVILLSKLWNESASRDIPQLTLTSSTMSWRTSSGDHAVVALYSNIPVPWTKEGRKGGREKGKRRDGNGGGGRKDEVYPTLPFFFSFSSIGGESSNSMHETTRDTDLVIPAIREWNRKEAAVTSDCFFRFDENFIHAETNGWDRACFLSQRIIIFVPRPETTLKPFFSFPFHFSTPLRNSTRL